VALMFSGAGSAAGFQPELAAPGRRVARLGLPAAAALLLTTPSLRGGRKSAARSCPAI
jgi:hypothetical protein